MPLILFNKPFQVLCQFTPQDGRESLADYIATPNIYPAGRLDADSEGLMLLTDDGRLQHSIAHPDHKEAKTYLVQVDGVADAAALARLQAPIDLGDFITKPCRAVRIAEPDWLWPRNPPIRARAGQADQLDRDHAAGRQEPPGAAHDGGGRAADAAAGAQQHRAVLAGDPSVDAGRVDRSAGQRAEERDRSGKPLHPRYA